MKKILNNLPLLFVLTFLIMIKGCKKPESQKTPDPLSVSIKLGDHLYNCSDYIIGDNPCRIVYLNNGLLKVSTTGVSTPQFAQTAIFEGSSFPYESSLSLQNNTETYGSHQIYTDGCIRIEVPDGEGCKITAVFNEGQGVSGSSCIGPNPELCFKWMKIQNIPQGTFSSETNCQNNPYVYIIDQVNPDGFLGSCN